MITKFSNNSTTLFTSQKMRLPCAFFVPRIYAVTFNPVTSRRKLFLQRGKQAALFAICANAVFFTLAYPLVLPFVSMVSKGKARLYAAATRWQFPTPYPLLATPNRRKLAAALSPNVKGKSIMISLTQNPPIQQAKSKQSFPKQHLAAIMPKMRLHCVFFARNIRRVTSLQVIRVSQPCTVWQTAVSFANRAKAAFFTSAFPLYCLFIGRQGQGGITPDGSYCHYCEPCLLSAAPTFRSVKAALLDQYGKVNQS